MKIISMACLDPRVELNAATPDLCIAPGAAVPDSSGGIPRCHNRGREVHDAIVGRSATTGVATTSSGGLPPPPLEEPRATTPAQIYA
jgi:hypothetical protein